MAVITLVMGHLLKSLIYFHIGYNNIVQSKLKAEICE